MVYSTVTGFTKPIQLNHQTYGAIRVVIFNSMVWILISNISLMYLKLINIGADLISQKKNLKIFASIDFCELAVFSYPTIPKINFELINFRELTKNSWN